MAANRAFTDPFEVLGLPHTASKADVKAAFRRQALRCHPDVDPTPQAAARFTEIKQAADAILKGHCAPGAAGPGPSSAYEAWQAYAQHRAASGQPLHPDLHDWRPRSRHTALWLCGLTLVAGAGVFWGALVSHEWCGGYTWLTPAVAEERLKHPTPRRQHLMALMLEERRAAGGTAQAAGAGTARATEAQRAVGAVD